MLLSPSKCFPLVEKVAVLIENLDAIVGTVGDKDSPLGVNCHENAGA